MSTSTEVMQVTTALAKFDKVAAGLAELEKSYKGVVYLVTTKDGMKAAVEARRAVKGPRVEIEKVRKDAKAPILELGRKLDSEAARITAALVAIENPIDEQIKNEENRLHEEAVAKATAERERVEAMEARLANIQTMPYDANGASVATCKAILDEAKGMEIGEDWQEFREKAKGALVIAVASLEGVLAKAVAAEVEAARIVAERAELEVLRKQQATMIEAQKAAQLADAVRIAAEQKVEAARLAALKAEQDHIEQQRIAAARANQEELDEQRAAFAKDQERVKAELAERIRIEQVNFRAHQNRMSPEQAKQFRALSDANPTADVYSLTLPVSVADIVLFEDKPAMQESLKVDPLLSIMTEDGPIRLNVDEDKERAAFEAWISVDKLPRAKDRPELYLDFATELCWQAWLERASRG